MNPAETTGCPEFADEVNRYAWGEPLGERRVAIENHLKECEPCRELAIFTKNLVTAVREDPERARPVSEPCPDASLIVGLEAEELDETTAKHVTAHVLHCKKCREAYLMLRDTGEKHPEEKALEGAETRELERRGEELRVLHARILELRATLKELQKLAILGKSQPKLDEDLRRASNLLKDIERAYMDMSEGKNHYMRMINTLLHHAISIGDGCIHMDLEYRTRLAGGDLARIKTPEKAAAPKPATKAK